MPHPVYVRVPVDEEGRHFRTPVARSIEEALNAAPRALPKNACRRGGKKTLHSKQIKVPGGRLVGSERAHCPVALSFSPAKTARADRVSDTCSYIDRSRSVDSPRPRNHPFAAGTRGGEDKFNPLSLLLAHIDSQQPLLRLFRLVRRGNLMFPRSTVSRISRAAPTNALAFRFKSMEGFLGMDGWTC